MKRDTQLLTHLIFQLKRELIPLFKVDLPRWDTNDPLLDMIQIPNLKRTRSEFFVPADPVQKVLNR
jgi:hypothetical protein